MRAAELHRGRWRGKEGWRFHGVNPHVSHKLVSHVAMGRVPQGAPCGAGGCEYWASMCFGGLLGAKVRAAAVASVAAEDD